MCERERPERCERETRERCERERLERCIGRGEKNKNR